MAAVRIPKLFLGGQNHTVPDTRADALLKHIVGVPAVTSVRLYQGQYVPDSTNNIEVAPGIAASIQDVSEDKNGELCRLTIRLEATKPEVTTRHLIDFVDACNTDYHLDMQNKLGNTIYVFEQVAGSDNNSYRGLPGMPKPKGGGRGQASFLQFSKTPFVTNRTLDNVFFEQRKVLRQRLDFFQNHKVCAGCSGAVLVPLFLTLVMQCCRSGTTGRACRTCWVCCCMGSLALAR